MDEETKKQIGELKNAIHEMCSAVKNCIDLCEYVLMRIVDHENGERLSISLIRSGLEELRKEVKKVKNGR